MATAEAPPPFQPQPGPDAASLPAGYSLNDYQIERSLGGGGFGITYLARDRNLDLTVAIKEYFPSDLVTRAGNQFVQVRQGASDEAQKTYAWGLERFLDDAIQTGRQKGAPGATFAEDDTSFTLSFDVPGIAKDQVTIGIEGSVVRITSKEGAPRQYKAAYELPQDIDPSGSDAKLDNGVLTLKLAKKVVVSPVSELTIH